MHGQVVCKNKLQCLANDRDFFLDMITMGGLEDLSDKRCTLEVVVDELLERAVEMLIEIFR